MHVDQNHPGLTKYRSARANKKLNAIARKAIRSVNPDLSDHQIDEIIKAQSRIKKLAR